MRCENRSRDMREPSNSDANGLKLKPHRLQLRLGLITVFLCGIGLNGSRIPCIGYSAPFQSITASPPARIAVRYPQGGFPKPAPTTEKTNRSARNTEVSIPQLNSSFVSYPTNSPTLNAASSSLQFGEPQVSYGLTDDFRGYAISTDADESGFTKNLDLALEPTVSDQNQLQETLQAEAPKTLGERLDKLGLLYSNDDNPILQEFWFLGRYHGQYHNSDGDVEGYEDWENRRFRIGSQFKVFEKMTVHAQMISGNDMEEFYNGFSELWVSWKFNDAFALTIGQQKHRFTHERNVSSRYINTLERSMLVNMFNSDYTPAVTALGEKDDWLYYTGIFSNATSSDMVDSFTDFDSGYSYLFSATKDLKTWRGTDSTHWNFCFLHSDANDNATNWNHFQNGLSSALIMTKDRRYLIAETLMGFESEQGNAYGLNLQPGFFLTDNLQFSSRYQIAASNEEHGLLPQRRYERPAGMTSGDFYQAIYGGLNYYFAEHRMKTMTGLEYSDMNGQGLWTASIMIRTYWGPHSSGPFPMAQTL